MRNCLDCHRPIDDCDWSWFCSTCREQITTAEGIDADDLDEVEELAEELASGTAALEARLERILANDAAAVAVHMALEKIGGAA